MPKHHRPDSSASSLRERPETNLVSSIYYLCLFYFILLTRTQVVLPIKNILDAHRVFGAKTYQGHTPIILKPGTRAGFRLIMYSTCTFNAF